MIDRIMSCFQIIALWALVGLAGGIFNFGAADDTRPAFELEVLKKKIERLQKRLDDQLKDESELLVALDASEREIVALDQDRARLETESHASIETQQKLADELAEVKSQNQASEQALIELIKSSYVMKRQGGMKLLLDGESPTEISRTLVFYRYLSEAKQQQLAALAAHQKHVQKMVADLDAQGRKTQALLDTLDANRDALAVKKSKREQQLQAIRQSLSVDHKTRAQYAKQEASLLSLLRQIDPAIVPDGQPKGSQQTGSDGRNEAGFASKKGLLPMPLKAPIQHLFGNKKQESGLVWKGLMITANEGQHVAAIYPAQVVYADWFRGYGQLVVLDHGDGYMSLYGHNQLLHVDIGDTVAAGQHIASAGQTGGLLEPGLYFEIRERGEAVNPLNWCLL